MFLESFAKIMTTPKNMFFFGFMFFLILMSLMADILCNEKPLVLSYKNHIYFPFLVFYPETEFGGDLELEADYKDDETLLKIKSQGWIVTAPIKFSPKSIDFNLSSPAPTPPDRDHILGTDDQGRDVFTRLLFGFRSSLFWGLIIAILSSCIGILLGGMQGFYGGLVDLMGQRIIEIWSSLPELFILIILTSLFTPSVFLVACFMSLMGWMGLSAYVRAEFLKLREQDFILGARCIGLKNFAIMRKHILPNALVPIITFFPFKVSGAITSLAALDFLGIGIGAQNASLGELLAQGKSNLHSPWILLSTFSVLATTILLLNFLGEKVKEAVDSY